MGTGPATPQAPHPHATHPHASHPHAPCDALRHALQANAERRLRDEDERLRQEAYEQRLAEAGADTTWERHRSQSELLPEKAFFGKEKLMEFIKGKKYKKLMTKIHKMIVGVTPAEKEERKIAARYGKRF